MIEDPARPAVGGMTVITGISTGDMGDTLSGGGGSIVTTETGAVHRGMIDTYGREPGGGGMTIFAGGIVFVRNRVIGPVNALPELLLDTVVAGTAGSRYVLRISRGVWIIRWKFIVCTMAIGASRRHDKPAFYQSTAVHTVLVASDDVIDLGIYPRCGLLTYAMTTPAKCRNIERIGWRRR